MYWTIPGKIVEHSRYPAYFHWSIITLAVIPLGCAGDRLAGPQPAHEPIDPVVRRALEASGITSGSLIVARRATADGASGAVIANRASGLQPAQEQLPLIFTVHPNGGTRNNLNRKEIRSGDPNQTMLYQIHCYEPGFGWTPRNGEIDSLYHINIGSPTGGHVEPPPFPTPKHDFSNTSTGRPLGRYDDTSGPTTVSGFFGPTTYTANIASGEERVVAHYHVTEIQSACYNQPATDQFRAIVEVPGLVRIPSHADIQLDTYEGDLRSHHEDFFWYLTPETIESTIKLGIAYRDSFQMSMTISAASLVQGGINDIKRNWAPKHYEHRIGTDVDIDDHLGNDDQPLFHRVARWGRLEAGFASCVAEDGDADGQLDHVHCRKLGYE